MCKMADRLKAASVGRQRRSHNFRCLACIKKFATESCAVRAQCEPHVPVRVQSHHRSIHIYPSRALHHRLPRLALHEAAIIGDSLHAGAPSRTSPSAPQMHAQRTSACAQLCKTRARWIPPGGRSHSISGVMASRQHIFAFVVDGGFGGHDGYDAVLLRRVLLELDRYFSEWHRCNGLPAPLRQLNTL